MSSVVSSLIRNTSVALTCCCSGAGVCLATHGKWNQGQKLQKSVIVHLTGELVKKLHHKAVDCIGPEKTQLSEFKTKMYYRTSNPIDRYTTERYKGCFGEVSYDDVVRKLFTENIE